MKVSIRVAGATRHLKETFVAARHLKRLLVFKSGLGARYLKETFVVKVSIRVAVSGTTHLKETFVVKVSIRVAGGTPCCEG